MATQCYLELAWMALVVYRLLLTLYVRGTGADVQQRTQPVPDKLGWFTFRKRMGVLHLVTMIFSLWVWWNTVFAYCYDRQPGQYFSSLLATVTEPRQATVDATSVVLLLTLTLLLCVYRLYVGTYVSIYSHRQTYGPLKALLFYAMPVLSVLSVVANGPELSIQEACLSLSSVSLRHLACVAAIGAALYAHRAAHAALARLRRNRFGHVTTTEYKQPKAGLFAYVCCPHYTADLVIVLCLALILKSSTAMWLFALHQSLVLVSRAYSSHAFYAQKFPDFPKERKMLIPYLF